MYNAFSQLSPHSLRSLERKYDEQASSWDRKLHCLGFNRLYERLLQDLASQGLLSGLDDSSRVLDIGIGTGAVSVALLEQITAAPHITGIDISSAMLRKASERLSGVGANYMLLQTDVREMSPRANGFDFVICAHVLEHLADPAQCISCIRQMLGPEGRFLLIITRCGPWGNYLRYRWGISPAKPNDVQAWFSQAGFTDITLIPLRGTPWGQFTSLVAIGAAT